MYIVFGQAAALGRDRNEICAWLHFLVLEHVQQGRTRQLIALSEG